jgi:site-specific recombinase XerD
VAKIIIHDYKRESDLQLKILEESNISAKNKRLIKDFYECCLNDGIGYARMTKYLCILRQIASVLKKDFDKATRKDIEGIVAYIRTQDYSEEGKKHDFKVIIKRFYKWLKGDNETYPKEVSWIKCTIKNRSHKLPESILTEDEIKKLIEHSDLLRDKCLLSVLYESGCRIAEILTLQLKNVQFDDIGAIIIVNGKTGMRRVRLISSVPYLQRWCNEHPMPDNPEAPLFVMAKNNSFLPYDAVRMKLKRLCQKAGIRKEITPHSFRHARATFLANKLTDAQMKEYFGWTQSSRMASTYIHLSGRDTDEAIQQVYGIKKDNEEKKKSILSPKKCPRCNEVNEASAKYCNKCWLPLDLKSAMEIEKKRKASDELINSLMENPESLRVIAKEIARLRLTKKVMKI